MEPKNKLKRFAFLMVKIGVTFGAFWILFWQIPFATVFGKMVDANFYLLCASLCIFLLIPLIQARRWHILIQLLDGKISLKGSIALTWLGLFFSSFLPSAIGGDVAKAWFARHEGFYFTRSLISVGMDRVFGMVVILVIIILSSPYYFGLLDEINLAYAASVIAGVVVGCVLAVIAIIFIEHIPPRLREKFGFIDQLCDCVGRIRKMKLWSLSTAELAAISLLGQVLQPLIYYLLAVAIGAQVGFLEFFFLTPFVTLAVALPIGIAGWGVREGAMVAIFTIIGARPEDMLAISLLSGIIVTIAALPGSISWLLIGKVTRQGVK